MSSEFHNKKRKFPQIIHFAYLIYSLQLRMLSEHLDTQIAPFLNVCTTFFMMFSNSIGLLMVRSRPNGPRSGLWTESVRSQVSKTMWTVWTVEFFYHKSICFLLKILFYYHNSIQIINKNAKFIHCPYEFLFFLKSNFLNK